MNVKWWWIIWAILVIIFLTLFIYTASAGDKTKTNLTKEDKDILANLTNISKIKVYDNGIISIKDSKTNNDLVRFKLLFNSPICGGDANCEGIIKAELLTKIPDLFNDVNFTDIKRKTGAILNFNIYFYNGTDYELYNDKLNNKTGEIIFKLVSTKSSDDIIDWIPTFSIGADNYTFTEWALWNNQQTYDECNANNISSNWSTLGHGVYSFDANVTLIGGYSGNATSHQGSCSIGVEADTLLSSNNLPNINTFSNLSVRAKLQVCRDTTCQMPSNTKSKITVFGTDLYTLSGDPGDYACLTDTSTYFVIRNYTSSNLFDYFKNGVYVGEFTGTNNIVSVYSQSGPNDANGAGSTSRSGIDYVYYTQNSGINVSLINPLNNTWVKSPVNFNCSIDTVQGVPSSNLSLYGNWTGSWILNETKNTSTDTDSAIFQKNLTEGNYIWNCYGVSSFGDKTWSYKNNTVKIDNTPPSLIINKPSVTESNTSIAINISVSDSKSGLNLSSCYFNITRGASVEVSDTIIPNCQNASAGLSGDATYLLTLKALDNATNINITSLSFTVSGSGTIIIITPPPSGGGGGGNPPLEITNETLAPNLESNLFGALSKTAFILNGINITWFTLGLTAIAIFIIVYYYKNGGMKITKK